MLDYNKMVQTIEKLNTNKTTIIDNGDVSSSSLLAFIDNVIKQNDSQNKKNMIEEGLTAVAYLFGWNFEEEYKKYGPLIDLIAEHYGEMTMPVKISRNVFSIVSNEEFEPAIHTESEENKYLRLILNRVTSFRDYKKYYTPELLEMLMKRHTPYEIKGLDQKTVAFILENGIENVVRFNKESGGFLSKKSRTLNKTALDHVAEAYCSVYFHKNYDSVLDYEDEKMDEGEIEIGEDNYGDVITYKTPITYEEFEKRMYETIIRLKINSGDRINYDEIKGAFREKNPDLFIETEELSDPRMYSLQSRFSKGQLEARDIREHPEWIDILKNKNLRGAFGKVYETLNTSYYYKLIEEKQKEGVSTLGISDEARLLSRMDYVWPNALGNEKFLELCKKYSKYMEFDFDFETLTDVENLRSNYIQLIEEQIYSNIVQGLPYDEELPETFKAKYPGLFLSQDIDEELRKMFYDGKLTFEAIKQHPELKGALEGKDLQCGFRHSESLCGFRNNFSRWSAYNLFNLMNESDVLELASRYGRYIDNLDELLKQCKLAEKISKDLSLEEKDKIIRDCIDISIHKNLILYDEDAPEFFKEKYPDMFLAEDAPEDIKKHFYHRYFLSITDEDEIVWDDDNALSMSYLALLRKQYKIF